jgi:hypothetical protein
MVARARHPAMLESTGAIDPALKRSQPTHLDTERRFGEELFTASCGSHVSVYAHPASGREGSAGQAYPLEDHHSW